MALQQLDHLQALVKQPPVTLEQQAQFLGLAKNFRRDFLALVGQKDRIDQMTEEMQGAASEITNLVRENVVTANQVMAQMERYIHISSDKKQRFVFWSVAMVTLLGVSLALFITLRIVRPLRAMAGMLDRLAYEEPTGRLPYYPGARDEVNAMADNKSRFIACQQNQKHAG